MALRQQTRTEQLRDTYQAAIRDLIAAHAFEVGEHEAEDDGRVTPAEIDGLVVIPRGVLEQGLARLFDHDFPLPERSDQAAEVRTPARIVVDARCPDCGQTSTGSIFVTPRLIVAYGGKRTLDLKAKTEPIDHACGQTHVVDVTPTEVEGQLSIDELAGPRCIGLADGEGTLCDHVEDEHAFGMQLVDASGEPILPCRVAGCGCDDLRLPEPSFVAELPEGESDGGHPTGDDAEVGPGPEAVDACPWPGCIRGANHGGKHSKGTKE
jgi:hypothetical protein